MKKNDKSVKFGVANIFAPDKNVSNLQMSLTIIMVLALVLSNVIVIKPINLFGLEMLPNTAACLMFPITYVLSDVFSEVYGYTWSRVTATWAMLGTALATVVFTITIALHGNAEWHDQDAIVAVLGNTPRIAAASIAAYWFGDWANDAVFQKLKSRNDSQSGFGVRAILSSIVGKYIDSAIVIFLGLSFIPFKMRAQMVLTEPIVYVGIELILLPLTIAVKNKIKKLESK